MMTKMNFLGRFLYSMIKIEVYRTFFHERFRKALVYLLLVSFVFSGIVNLRIAVGISRGIDEFIQVMAKEVPYFELKNGVLSVEADMPLIFEDSPGSVWIIDTSGTLDARALDAYENGIFVYQHGVVEKADGLVRNTHLFSSFGMFTVTKRDVETWLPLLKWVNVFIIVFGFLFYFTGKLVSALMLSIGGLMIQAILKFQGGFGNLMKLSIYALTLSMLLKFLLSLGDVTIPYFWILYYGMALFYVWKALEMLRREDEGAAAAGGEALF